MPFVGFDSKEFRRRGTAPGAQEFFAPLGVGVEIASSAFPEKYSSVIAGLCQEFGVQTDSLAVDSNSLEQVCGLPKSIAMIERFLEGIDGSISEMTVFFSVFSTTNVPRVKVYGRDRNVEEIPTIKFLRDINPHFVHLCAWKYIRENGSGNILLLDNFECKESIASQELLVHAKQGNLRIYPHGDVCNAYVSTADLLAKLVDARLYMEHERLSDEAIVSVFHDIGFPVKTQFIGQPDLPDIVPLSRNMVDLAQAYAHPLFFVVLDSDIEWKKAKELFESSPNATRVANLAFEANGAFAIFNIDKDAGMIRDGDTFIETGSKSHSIVDFVSGLYNITSIKARDLR